jgi:hypothetical protein
MSRHAYVKITTLLAVTALLGLPAAGSASDGGASADAPAPSAGTGSPNGITLSAGRATLVHRTVTVRGSVPRGSGDRVVLVERSDRRAGWVQIARVRPARDGTFSARWRSSRAGRVRFRARFESAARSAGQADSAPQVKVTVYQPARATWYGPGFYGHRTACGIRLTRRTLGVAHRKLRCGTKVDLYYRGRTIRVPVIDRGPYANGADWDVTGAAAARLHMRSTATIGTLVSR